MSFEMDLGNFNTNIADLTTKMLDAAEKAMHDSIDDLVLISSNIAPIDTDTLRKKHTQSVKRTKNNIVGEVAYSVSESSKGYGRFNYALAMHEWIYTPSQQGSYNGYAVGRKYLERPLYGEAAKYATWIANDVKGASET